MGRIDGGEDNGDTFFLTKVPVAIINIARFSFPFPLIILVFISIPVLPGRVQGSKTSRTRQSPKDSTSSFDSIPMRVHNLRECRHRPTRMGVPSSPKAVEI